jgi:hypothetical protein
MKKLVCILGILACLPLLASCMNKNYQWFFDKSVGIRIDNIKTRNNVIELMGSISNRGATPIVLDGACWDASGEEYCLINMENPVRLRELKNEVAFAFLTEMQVLPSEERNIYYHSWHKDKDDERFKSLKKPKEGQSYVRVKIKSVGGSRDTTIKVNY